MTAEAASQSPEEQPFERDGSWWFRRDGELLTYDESSSQWVPAPEGPHMEPEDAPSEAQTAGHAGPALAPPEASKGPMEPEVPAGEGGEPVAQFGSFWRCSTCSAVNGSAASSCRMCFRARP